ncbi:MAG: glycine--tRNA ligase subunit beta [Campylobacteraceae bacterium]|jgi:glycyl-tRNA synthetase beta chain|nr:glycine--tRNA ligase subunit beta [Campylobacteraceae bacterium]
MQKPLLIEIGVEELPAIPFLKEFPNIKAKWSKILEANELFSEFDFFYTPRRLVFWHKNFLVKQPNHFEEFFGAPEENAYEDGKPTAAAIGFAKKCGVDVDKLERAQKGDKRVLYYKKDIEGKESKDLIEKMLNDFLKSLNFGKSMRWGNCEESFIRPIRWLTVMLGDEVLQMQVFGVKSNSFTYPHRSLTSNKFTFSSVGNYFEELVRGFVVLSQDERYEKIISQIDALEAISDINVEKDKELLEEVVAITEHPTVLMGNFDELFLKLPPEVIITSMKENQRYFPVFENNSLSNHFVVVSNAVSNDYILIIKGNEKVLHARLSDALFFYENDLKKGLQTEGLKSIVYIEGLGSLYDKSRREERIGAYIANANKKAFLAQKDDLSEDDLNALLAKALTLAKADLLSEMVGEFPELQGVMGYYYALEAKEDKMLALALKEQYLPNNEESALPSTLFSAIVALSNKVDSLMALFSIGKIPTGTKDPFALRRAVNGIIKIVLKYNLKFNIRTVFGELCALYSPFDILQLESFFIERLYQLFDKVNSSIITAVIEGGERDIVKIAQKIEVLKNISQEESFKEVFSTFKRVANIIKDINCDAEHAVYEVLLQDEAEKALFEAYTKTVSKEYENFDEKLRALFALKPFIDTFFNNVMVNVDDQKIKQNRLNIIASIYKAFKSIADIKEISV